MSIPFKTEIGIVYLAMAINCSEYKAKKADDGKSYEEIKCIAKTVNHKCASCSLINPNSPPSDRTDSPNPRY